MQASTALKANIGDYTILHVTSLGILNLSYKAMEN